MSAVDKTPLILLVEDLSDDVVLVRRSLDKAAIKSSLRVVTDGEQAISYLSGDGHYADRLQFPLPDLVLLDLKLPCKDGFEVLKWIREQPHLKKLRVIVLTSSDHIWDVNRAHQLGANSFLVKPVDLQNYLEMGHFVSGYWLGLDKAPEILQGPKKVDGQQ